MTATVTKIPSASPSYYTVRKHGRKWGVQIVTPSPFSDLRTTVATTPDRDEAIRYGIEQAAAVHRPFKMGGKVIEGGEGMRK
jgi:hypothetical protein